MIEIARPQIRRFDEFVYDFEHQVLTRSGKAIELQEQSRRFLECLLLRAPGVVSRDDLRMALWRPDVVVDFERGITVTASKLRQKLGSMTSRRLVTVPGRGYRWRTPDGSTQPMSSRGGPELEARWQRRRPHDLVFLIRATRRRLENGHAGSRTHFLHAAATALAADYGWIRARSGFERACAAVERALRRWPDEAEWWALRGFLDHRWRWRPDEAERSFENALDLRPDSICALQWFGEFASQSGRHDLAILCTERASRQTLFASVTDAVHAWVRLHAADRHGARACIVDARRLGRSTPLLEYVAARAEDDPDRALNWLDRAVRSGGEAAHLASERVRRLVEVGREAEANRVVASLRDLPHASYHRAKALAALRREKAAMDALDEALRDRSPWALDLGVDPDWDAWRDHPRFAEMAARSPFGLRP